MDKAILSVFTGLGLLDEAFKREGFCVVSAGDIITGQDIRNFITAKDSFQGVIGGSPCQDISGLKPKRFKTDYSLEMIEQFKRIVKESCVSWYLHENVRGVPNVEIEGFNHQRLVINQGWYENVQRNRVIQFGCTTGHHIHIEQGTMEKDCVSLALASDDRPFHELKKLQGLPLDFDLPDFTLAGKKKLVGNGVPLSMGLVIAKAVKKVIKSQIEIEKNIKNREFGDFVTNRENNIVTKYCLCGCGRETVGSKKYYHRNCRKQAQRKRDKIKGINR